MKTPQFDVLIAAMTPTQQSALEELEQSHPDIKWDGGKVDTRPQRVSIKTLEGKNIAAINTREKEAFLRLEFRTNDYHGRYGIRTNHRNFDKAYDLFDHSNVAIASEIISEIKNKYIQNITATKPSKLAEKKPNNNITHFSSNLEDFKKEKYIIISVMGPHAGESEREIFERKINDTKKIGITFWLMRSRQAKPAMVQDICKKALSDASNVLAIFIEASSVGGAVPTVTAQAAKRYSADGKNWELLPDDITPVTGKIDSGAYALTFNNLQLSDGTLDLWEYADYFDQSTPIKIFQGASTLCAVKKEISSHVIKSRYRKIIAIGKLSPPYGVWLR